MRVSVKLDIDQARRDFAHLKGEVNKAAARALERTAVTCRKEADQEIRQRLNLRSATVKAALRIGRPLGRKSLVRDVEASGKPIPLREFAARSTRKGVTFAVRKGKGQRKVYARKGRKGFMGRGKLPDRVFVATGPNPPGPKQAPIKQVFGPAIPQYFVTKGVRERMRAAAAARWSTEFARELQFRASRAAR